MKTVNLNCKTCGKEYISKECKKDISKYCSFDCKKVGQSKLVPWQKGKTKKDFPQLSNAGCKKGNIPWNKGIKNPKLSGPNHPNWKKDRTQLAKRQERNDMAYKEWRNGVKNRDHWKCRMSNEECSGKLVAHHIFGWANYPELRYIINNGITLCHAHHPRKRAEEKRLIPLYLELVSVSEE